MTAASTVALEHIRRRVAADPAVTAVGGSSADAQQRRLQAVRAAVARAVRAEGLLLPAAELGAVVRDLMDVLAGLGPVERLLRDPDVTDVMINGPQDVWVERADRLERVDMAYPGAAELVEAVTHIIGPLGLRLDRARPYVDARLPDGSRLHAVLPPVAPDGPLVTIRRFAQAPLDWTDLLERGSLTAEAAAVLRQVVAERRAVLCCGPTGSGKTTLLGLLLAGVSARERVVLIEEAAELQPACPHLVRLEACPANVEGAGAVTLRELVRQALRMRPDRIVVGEMRGDEVVDVLQAMSTGHDGCMSTVHARSAEDTLVRLQGMALLAGVPVAAVQAQLRIAADVIVALERTPDGGRVVRQIAQVHAQGPGLKVRDLWRR